MKLSTGGGKLVFLLCTSKPAFVKFGHIHTYMLHIYKHIIKSFTNLLLVALYNVSTDWLACITIEKEFVAGICE